MRVDPYKVSKTKEEETVPSYVIERTTNDVIL